MGSSKEAQTYQDAQRNEGRSSLDADEDLPTYQDSNPGELVQQLHPTGSSTSSYGNPIGPTVSSPFNFPVTTQAPPNYSATPPNERLIAIPQQFADPAAPFLPAYAPVLLQYGIPHGAWYSFLDTMSAFLTARVGKRAISHAGDIAASVGRVPKKLGKDVANHAKHTFQHIGQQAKNLNPLGVITGVVGGAVSLTVGTSLRVVGSVLHLPGTALVAGANMKTPRDRAQAYTSAANKDWFHKRGLHAHLVNTVELAGLLDVTPQQLLNAASSASGGAAGKMEALRDLIEGVEIRQGGSPGKAKAHAQPQTPPPELSPAGFPADVKRREEPEEHNPEAGPSNSQAAPHPQKETDPNSLLLSAQTLWLVLMRATAEELAELAARQ